LKKIVIGAIAALVLAYPLLSWLMGFAVEKRINEPLEQIRNTTSYVKLVDSRFRRGWFSSEQDLTIEMFPNLPAAAAGAPLPAMLAPFQLKIHTVIRHGPLCGWACVGIAHAETHVIFSGQVQDWLTTLFGSVEPLHIESRMGIRGGGSATVSSPPIEDAVLKDGAHVSWGGFSVKSLFSAGYSAYSVHGSVPHTVYATADGKRFEISDLNLEVHSQRALRTLYEGDSSMSVGRFAFSSPAAAGSVTLNDIHATSQTGSNGGYMAFVSKTSTGALTTAPLTLTNMHFDFSLRHLEMESLEAMSVAMRDVNQEPSLAPQERNTKMMKALKTPALSLLSHQPAFGIDRISIATAQGEAQLSGVVGVHDVVPADFAEGADPKAIIQKLDADLDCGLEDAFLKSLPGSGAQFTVQLQALADQGLLTHENGKFHTKIAFHQGTATFNGKPFPEARPPPASPSRLPSPRLPPPPSPLPRR
jgi:uncharacterized protein YdgA (DUF945 family)